MRKLINKIYLKLTYLFTRIYAKRVIRKRVKRLNNTHLRALFVETLNRKKHINNFNEFERFEVNYMYTKCLKQMRKRKLCTFH